MFDLQRPTPVLSLSRHFQCKHGASIPGTRSSDWYGCEFLWYISQVVGPRTQSFCWRVLYHSVTECMKLFLASGVYLQARDCIGNTWSHQPMDNMEMSQQITYRRYVQQERNSGRSGATMNKILHATVVSYQRTPDICWNISSLHIPALWMTFYSSTKQGNSV